MKEKLHKAVVPSDQNDGVPLLLQASGAVVLTVVAFAIFALANLHGHIVNNYAGSNYAAVVAAVLIDQTNEERQDLGLPALEPNALLMASAQLKADDMATESYFAHESPSGLSPWHWFEQAGYRFSYAGENLAVNFRDSGAVTKAWMNSPSHRDNIVNRNYKEIGIATAVGRYKGNRTTFVAQHFGAPYQQNEIDLQTLRELLGGEVSAAEVDEAVREADQLLAAVGEVGTVQKLFIQPEKIYSTFFLIVLAVVLAVGTNAYVRSDSRAKQKQILLHALMIAIMIIALGLTTLKLLQTEIIAASLQFFG